jgi:AbrB family looped-hinge helix DNA binding protein
VTDHIEETLKVGTNGRVTIPKDLRDEYGIEDDDRINVTFHLNSDE